MSNPNPNRDNLRPFQPGNPGGPGRPPEVDPRLKQYTKKEIGDCICKMLKMTLDEITSYVKHPEASAMEVIIGSVIRECMKKGDIFALDKMLERVIGKVPQKTQLTGDDGAPLIPPSITFAPISPRQDTPPHDPPGQ